MNISSFFFMAITNMEIIRGRLDGTIPAPGSLFEKATTPGIVAFEIAVLLGFIIGFFIVRRFAGRAATRFALMGVGVLIFEMFTAPMWRNLRLGNWAYLFQQTSWVLALGWSALVLGTIVLVDHFAARKGELARFVFYLVILTPIVFAFEILLVALGVRSYAPEVMQAVSGHTLFQVPLEAFYYVPVFLSLIIGFYKYWGFVLDGALIIPPRKTPWLRTFFLSALAVFLFELMVAPMVQNVGFPSWSYICEGITLVLTLAWVVAVWIAVNFVDKFLAHWSLANRFLVYLGVIALLAIPVESWLIAHGFRIYGPSAVANFSRLTIPGTSVPLEVCFAIPLYFALVIGFIRYLEIAITNRKMIYVR